RLPGENGRPPFSLNRSTRNRQCRFRFGFYAEGVTEHSPGSPRLCEAHPGNAFNLLRCDPKGRIGVFSPVANPGCARRLATLGCVLEPLRGSVFTPKALQNTAR